MDFLRACAIRCFGHYGSKFQITFYSALNSVMVIKLQSFTFKGVVGTIFIKGNLFWCRFRKYSKLGQYPVTEVMVVTLVTAIISYPNPYTRLNMSQLIYLLFNQCGISNSDPLW